MDRLLGGGRRQRRQSALRFLAPALVAPVNRKRDELTAWGRPAYRAARSTDGTRIQPKDNVWVWPRAHSRLGLHNSAIRGPDVETQYPLQSPRDGFMLHEQAGVVFEKLVHRSIRTAGCSRLWWRSMLNGGKEEGQYWWMLRGLGWIHGEGCSHTEI